MAVTKETRPILKAKQTWNRTRAQNAAARDQLNAAIREAVADGMTQAEVARILGWPRQRVNTVVGES